jgi:adenylate cyclase
MAKLLVRYENDTTNEFDIGTRSIVKVGRELDNTLILNDPHASRKHFYIRQQNGAFTLFNLSHTHGTVVNGERTERCELRGNEVIEAGATKMTFVLGEASAEYPERSESAVPPPEHTSSPSLAAAPTSASPPVVQRPLSSGVSQESAKSFESVRLADGGPGSETGSNPSLLATSDPSKSTILAAFESAAGGEVGRRFRLLQDIGQQMVTKLNLDEVLEFLLDNIFQVLPADNGLILLLDAQGTNLVPSAVRLKDAHSMAEGKLRVSQTLLRHCFQKRVGVLSADALCDDRFSAKESIMALGIHSVMCVPMIFQDTILGVIQVDSQTTSNTFNQADLDLLTMLANQAALSVRNSRLHDQLVQEEMRRASLERYFSPQIAREIADKKMKFDGESVEATVLFSDVRDFTPLSERTEPAELVRFLNHYFGMMGDIVFEFNGTLDKFIGDALVAVFGSPFPRPDDSINAARCAEKMIRTVRETEFSVGKISIGIGLHRGKVVHGDIGSEKVMKQYTCIGDTVNTSSRLSTIAKPDQIVLSPAMKEVLGETVETKALGRVELKGKSEPMNTFELIRCL